MKQEAHRANVYRFHDRVAVKLGSETIYLTPNQAEKIGQLVCKCADDVRQYETGCSQFVQSTVLLADPYSYGLHHLRRAG